LGIPPKAAAAGRQLHALVRQAPSPSFATAISAPFGNGNDHEQAKEGDAEHACSGGEWRVEKRYGVRGCLPNESRISCVLERPQKRKMAFPESSTSRGRSGTTASCAG
jgi:hypothetical protein